MFPSYVNKKSVFQIFKMDETCNDQRLKSMEDYITKKRSGDKYCCKKGYVMRILQSGK